jgi:hypothetical protein
VSVALEPIQDYVQSLHRGAEVLIGLPLLRRLICCASAHSASCLCLVSVVFSISADVMHNLHILRRICVLLCALA